MTSLVRNRIAMYGFIVSVLLATAPPLPAFAKESHDFQIQTDDPALAIQQFGTQSGVQIFASADQLAGKKLNAVTGKLSTDDGLTALLAGTGLTHRYVGARTVALVKEGSAEDQTSTDGDGSSDAPVTAGRLRLAQEEQ